MGVVQLQILEPADGRTVVGPVGVRLHGAVVSAGPGPLFLKWYSSLAAAPLGTTADFIAPLGVGSHTVCFTAKDVAGDSPADLQAVVNAGMAGGPAAAEAPCRVHVFAANLVEPAAPGAFLNAGACVLSAQAPVQWPNADYQAVNRVRYHWHFDPSGPPPNRSSFDLIPTLAQLVFDASGAVPVVRYSGPLPAGVSAGPYILTLRVEDAADPATGHAVSRAVVVT
jgi:hypothetical protein